MSESIEMALKWNAPRAKRAGHCMNEGHWFNEVELTEMKDELKLMKRNEEWAEAAIADYEEGMKS